MEIILKIERNNRGTCNQNCVFLDAEYSNHSGTCLLFQQALRPVMEYGDVIDWWCCISCNKIATKILAIEVAETLDDPF